MPEMKRRPSRFLEAPPAATDTKGILSAPELAPAASLPRDSSKALPSSEIDGRSLRRTGRTVAFGTRVSPEWKAKLHEVAELTGQPYVVVLEKALYDLATSLQRDRS